MGRWAEIVAGGCMVENGFTGDITISIDARTGRNALQAVFSVVGDRFGVISTRAYDAGCILNSNSSSSN